VVIVGSANLEVGSSLQCVPVKQVGHDRFKGTSIIGVDDGFASSDRSAPQRRRDSSAKQKFCGFEESGFTRVVRPDEEINTREAVYFKFAKCPEVLNGEIF
jgi:hypothetical protein